MNSAWKIHIRDRDNLKELLNLLLVNRETEIAIRRNGGLALFLKKGGSEMEIIQYVQEELGNKVENSYYLPVKRENVFLSNLPKHYLNSFFPFLLETALFSINGDIIYLKSEIYKTINPLKLRTLGQKKMQVLYRLKINTPFLYRYYSNSKGDQSLSFKEGYPVIVTSIELNSLINGGIGNGLLAL